MNKIENPSCSFCGNGPKQAKKLIAGPYTFICDECVGLCVAVLAEEYKPADVTQQMTLSLRVKELELVIHRAVALLGDKIANTVWRCVYCDEITHSDVEARSHAMTCEKHPAVVALKAYEVSRG